MNDEEQIRILQMVADGILSAEEGEGLLDALGDADIVDMTPVVEKEVNNRGGRKWLRYQVIDEKSGVESVNLRLPANIFSGLFSKRMEQANKIKDVKKIRNGKVEQAEPDMMVLNILGENDGKRFKLYFE